MIHGIRARLKTVTQPLHDEIELNRLSKNIAAGTIDMDSYILFLSRMLAFIEPIEKKTREMSFWSECRLDPLMPMRSIFLREDLEYLGGTSDYGIERECVPYFADSAGAFGVLYVLEGSMVGASMQAPMAAKSLELGAEGGMRYLTNGGKPPMATFGAFLTLLEHNVKTATEQKNCLLAACDTFMSLKIWLDQ